jgi:lipopolysaccharide export system protein LptC
MSSPTAEPVQMSAVARGLAAEDIQRRQRLMKRWRRHSIFIRTLRRLLPAICVLSLLVLAGWATANALFWRLGVQTQASNLVIRMLKPNFQGRDLKGQPYNLTADSALRDDADAARIVLEAPIFTLGSSQASTVVHARHGIYREDNRLLDLTGHVLLDDAQGYHFVTEHALIDTIQNNVDGDKPVEGHGPLGQIAASSYAIRSGGAHVYFTGHVKARIEHHKPVAEAAAPAQR